VVYITQLIYINEGKEALFFEFEDVAFRIMWKYRAQVILRMRPTSGTFVENSIEPPFEIHIVAFETEKDFEQYLHDEERKSYLHLKEQSVRSVVLIKGVQI
jgi:hypothetical protein